MAVMINKDTGRVAPSKPKASQAYPQYSTSSQAKAQEAVRQAQERGAAKEAYVKKNYTQASNGNWVEKPAASTYSAPSYSNNSYSGGSSYSDYSGGGGGGGGGGGDYYDNSAELAAKAKAEAEAKAKAEAEAKQRAIAAALEAMRKARVDAINSANLALDEQGKASEANYNSNLIGINNDYDKLVNQSEVNRYKAGIGQREALANRGALDSGAGRQENLIMRNNYDNALNDIQTNRNSEISKVKNAIASMWSNVNTQKASNMTNGLNDYNSALNTLINSTYSGYTPESSDYYAAARAALSNGANALAGSGTGVANQGSVAAALTGNSGDAYSALLKAILSGKNY